MDVKLAKEIAEKGFAPIPTREKDFGVTVDEYSKFNHCSIETARLYLNQAAEANIGIVKSFMMHNGFKVIVYHRATP